MANVVIIGPRGVGKTRVSQFLARDIRGKFIDGDLEFIAKYGRVGDFVRAKSWSEFRAKETEILREVCSQHYSGDVVLAPGGGAVAHNQGEEYRLKNVELLKRFGKVFYIIPYAHLPTSAAILERRIADDFVSASQRPSLSGQSVLEILQERDPLYRAAADETIMTKEFTAYQIAAHIKKILRQN